jgi:hypothetical protein
MERESISIERLDVHNYPTWSFRMEMLLKHKGLWSVVASGGSGSKDEKALALICLNMQDHHLPQLRACQTAQEAWQQLESAYKAKNNARKLQLRRDLVTLRKEPAEPVAKYISRARDLMDALLATGEKTTESEVVMAVLNGLPKD